MQHVTRNMYLPMYMYTYVRMYVRDNNFYILALAESGNEGVRGQRLPPRIDHIQGPSDGGQSRS